MKRIVTALIILGASPYSTLLLGGPVASKFYGSYAVKLRDGSIADSRRVEHVMTGLKTLKEHHPKALAKLVLKYVMDKASIAVSDGEFQLWLRYGLMTQHEIDMGGIAVVMPVNIIRCAIVLEREGIRLQSPVAPAGYDSLGARDTGIDAADGCTPTGYTSEGLT